MHCPRRSRPSTMPWPSRSDKYTCSCTPAGQPGTIMPNTKRNVGKGTKSELASVPETMKVSSSSSILMDHPHDQQVSWLLSSVAGLDFSVLCMLSFFLWIVAFFCVVCVLVVQPLITTHSSIPWTIYVHWHCWTWLDFYCFFFLFQLLVWKNAGHVMD